MGHTAHRSVNNAGVAMTGGKYRYTKSHEWALVEGKTATVGISNYAQVSPVVFNNVRSFCVT